MSQATERKAAAVLLRRIANGGTLDAESAAAALARRSERTVLVIGSGGREHAIAWKLAQSADVKDVMVCPGNGGTALAGGKIRNVAKMSHEDVPTFALKEGVDLVVVGPEQPLVEGLADALAAVHVPCFGPSKLAAEIEASKAWAKDFMGRHNIPTSKHATFNRDQLAEAEEYAKTCGFPLVVKASGLAAGKGVLIPDGLDATLSALREVMVDDAFGAAGDEVVLEERMEGPEASMLAFCDGVTVRMMPAAQDHKRIGDGDKGLNTGGMGAYAPAPLVTPDIAERVLREVLEPAVKGLAEEGRPFVGVLYAGMMMTPNDGPRVVEFNCRFGDPETQVLLPLLDSDLFHVMESCALGTLASMGELDWKSAHAVTVVAASPGYPIQYPKGRQIYGLDDVLSAKGAVGLADEVMVFHAGTRLRDGSGSSIVETSGGRVLVVTSLSNTSLRLAVSGAYAGMRALDFEGMQYRYDIAARALTDERPLRVAVLGSTRGTDLGSLLEAFSLGRAAGVSISVVVSNRKSSEILGRAEAAGIPAVHVPCPKGMARETYDQAVTAVLEEHGPIDLVLMIGYMRIVSPSFTARWSDRLINVHPSLLPEFAGGMDMDVHAEVLKAGKDVTGCTVHFVTDVVDGGPIVCRRHVKVDSASSSPFTLKAKVQIAEGEALLSALRAFQDGTAMSIAAHFSASESGPEVESKRQVTYADAGVSIEEGNALIEDIKPHCKATRRSGCDASLGGFGGCFDMRAAGWAERLTKHYSTTPLGSDSVLVACTDGVGTKLKVAQIAGRHDTVGIDLVAMSVNDLIVQGAEPLFFLDYFACGKLDRGVASAVVRGIAKGCIDAGCGLIGGETAEMPSMYEEGDYDLAGFAVGAVRRSALLPQKLSAGDVVIGLTSSGIHSNGFSLIRKLVSVHGLDWEAKAPFDTGNGSEHSRLCDVILEPTRIYVKALLPLLGAGDAGAAAAGDDTSDTNTPAMPNAAAKPGKIKALAHITGGGLVENIPRVLADGMTVHLDGASWKEGCPPVFSWIAGLGSVPLDDMFRTFNCGIGMCVVVAKDDAKEVLADLRARGEGAFVIGEVRNETSPEEDRVTIVGTPF